VISTQESTPRRGKKVLDELRIELDLTDADEFLKLRPNPFKTVRNIVSIFIYVY